jgi:outer membrane protein
MKNLKVFLIFLIFLTANSVTFAQKIGVVDTNYILSKMPQYTEAQARLEEQIKAWETELQTLQAEYDAISIKKLKNLLLKNSAEKEKLINLEPI